MSMVQFELDHDSDYVYRDVSDTKGSAIKSISVEKRSFNLIEIVHTDLYVNKLIQGCKYILYLPQSI